MDCEKIFIVGAYPQIFQNGRDINHIQADIVVIDTAQKELQPLLYQLKRDLEEQDFQAIRQNLIHLSQNDFLYVGEVEEINKQKKIIYLSNRTTVSYKHLVTTSSHKALDQEREFAAALRVLMDALILQKIPTPSTKVAFESFLEKKKRLLASLGDSNSLTEKEVIKVANHHLSHEEEDRSRSLAFNNGRTFSLHL